MRNESDGWKEWVKTSRRERGVDLLSRMREGKSVLLLFFP